MIPSEAKGRGGSSSTVAEALRQGATRLREAGIEAPALEARLLLAHATGRDQAALLLDRDVRVDPRRYHALLTRRAAREPIAHIMGHTGFWTLELAVSEHTLIPRPDSETLIQAAVEARPRDAVRRILDLGTGTGCLLLAALVEFPHAWGVGIDRVEAAVALARRNAAGNGLAARAAFICADWATCLAAGFDLVLSNPPYVTTAELGTLMPEVAQFEPASALDGGPDGLDAYRALLPTLPRLLTEGGFAILEVGAGQAGEVSALAKREGFRVEAHRDFGGHERALSLIRPTQGGP